MKGLPFVTPLAGSKSNQCVHLNPWEQLCGRSVDQAYLLRTDPLEGSKGFARGEGGVEERDLLDRSQRNVVLLRFYET